MPAPTPSTATSPEGPPRIPFAHTGDRTIDVTVVIPTRNRRQRLAATLAGVLRQRGVDLEVIVVDEASSDGTSDMVLALGDPRVRLIRHDTPQRVARARNAGMAAGRGRWYALLDDDDLWAPDKLRRQLDAAEAKGAGLAYTSAVYVSSRGDVLDMADAPDPIRVREQIARVNLIPAGASNVVLRADVVEQAGGFDPALMHMADWDMWIRAVAVTDVAAVAEPLVGYVLHPSSMRRRQTDEFAAELRYIERRHHGGRAPATAGYHETLRWMADEQRRGGARFRAAARYVAMASRYRSPSDALFAVKTLVDGAWIRTLVQRFERRQPMPEMQLPAWLREYPEFPVLERVADEDDASSAARRAARFAAAGAAPSARG